jgi:hypothetical protein
MMKYCKNCGNEIGAGIEYCPNCGYKTYEEDIIYRKQRTNGTTAVKILAILFGGLLILVGGSLIFAGTAVSGLNRGLIDNDGYIGIRGIDFNSYTQALVFKTMEIDSFADELEGPGVEYWGPKPGDFVKIKITLESNNDKNLFIGITRDSNARNYLSNAQYTSVAKFSLEDSNGRRPEITYETLGEKDIAIQPQDLDIWEVFQTGQEITLTWEPDYGDFWVIIMNTDLSKNVDIEAGIGARVPFLGYIGGGLMMGGLICFSLGAAIIYFGVIRRVNYR